MQYSIKYKNVFKYTYNCLHIQEYECSGLWFVVELQLMYL